MALRERHFGVGTRHQDQARQTRHRHRIDEFAHRLERAGVVKLVPVDSDIWLRSLNLGCANNKSSDSYKLLHHGLLHGFRSRATQSACSGGDPRY